MDVSQHAGKPGEAGRWVRTFGYLALSGAGMAAIIWPPPSVREAASPTTGWLTYAWAIMIVVGGLLSASGTVMNRWFGEYVGLWPLVVTLFVYSLAAVAAPGRMSVAGSLLFAAFALLFLARWRHVAMVRHEAARIQQISPGRPARPAGA
jgi:hypothetical protein